MKKSLFLSVSFFLTIGITVACGKNAREERGYQIKAQGLAEVIAKQASACVSQSKAYLAAWEYAKVTETDFETALSQILGDEAKQSRARMIENKAMIDSLLEELKDPPDRFMETYKILVDLHELYGQLHNLSLKPSNDMEIHNKKVDKLTSKIETKIEDLNATFLIE